MDRASGEDLMVRLRSKRAILDCIYHQGSTSRVALSKRLDISKPAISSNVGELLATGIIEEIGTGASVGGRKPTMLRINANHRYVVAVDLPASNASKPLYALGNLDNRILCDFTTQEIGAVDLDTGLDILQNGICRLLDMGHVSMSDVSGIYLASPGVYDRQGNSVRRNPKFAGLSWAGVNLREALLKRYGLSVNVVNDVKAATLGEWALTGGEDDRSLLYVSCGVGFGAGIILDRRLYAGRDCSAGEIYNYADRRMMEKGIGLEELVSEKRLTDRVNEALDSGKPSILLTRRPARFEDVIWAYQRGDPLVMDLVRETCLEICLPTINLANFLNVDKVVFGGEYTVFGNCLLEQTQALVKEYAQYAPQVTLASLGDHSGIYGLLYLAREAYFDQICSRPLRREVFN